MKAMVWPFMASASVLPHRRVLRGVGRVDYPAPTIGTLLVVDALTPASDALGAIARGELRDPALLAFCAALSFALEGVGLRMIERDAYETIAMVSGVSALRALPWLVAGDAAWMLTPRGALCMALLTFLSTVIPYTLFTIGVLEALGWRHSSFKGGYIYIGGRAREYGGYLAYQPSRMDTQQLEDRIMASWSNQQQTPYFNSTGMKVNIIP